MGVVRIQSKRVWKGKFERRTSTGTNYLRILAVQTDQRSSRLYLLPSFLLLFPLTSPANLIFRSRRPSTNVALPLRSINSISKKAQPIDSGINFSHCAVPLYASHMSSKVSNWISELLTLGLLLGQIPTYIVVTWNQFSLA